MPAVETERLGLSHAASPNMACAMPTAMKSIPKGTYTSRWSGATER